MGTSRRGGVPTVLPPAGTAPVGQLGLGLDDAARAEPCAPSCSTTSSTSRGWLDADAQRALVADFRRWAAAAGRAAPPAGAGRPPDDACSRCASAGTGSRTPTAARPTTPTARRSSRCPPTSPRSPGGPSPTRSARGAGAGYAPDAAIVNLYAPGARLGLHQDGEEPSDAPVVTISLGDTCVFRLAGVDRRTGPFTDVVLRSGDLLVFGGANRRIYHGVPKVLDGTGPATSGCRRAGSASRSGRPACDRPQRRTSRIVARRRWHHVAVRPFEELVREHGAVVMRVCRALLPHGRRRGRLVGDVPLRAARVPAAAARQQRARLAGDDRPPQGARPAARHGRAAPMPAADVPDRGDDRSRAGRRRPARRGRRALPTSSARAVVYHHLAGLPYADVAARLGSTRPPPGAPPPTASPAFAGTAIGSRREAAR